MPIKKIVLTLKPGNLSSSCHLGDGCCTAMGHIFDRPATVFVVDKPLRRNQAGLLAEIIPDRIRKTGVLTVPGGERVKTVAGLESLYSWLARRQIGRDGTLVAVGGGAVLDLVGMAAATWQRGIRFITVPTTLLAMVDAAIGGKTAINTAGLKNPVGCFHPADTILADPAFLGSLPRREWRSGMAELIKTAVIGSRKLFRDVYGRREEIALLLGQGNPRTRIENLDTDLPWGDWIFRAARIKTRIVNADFREGGQRRALNLGHTLGHVLESHTREHHNPLTHGEAIAIGMATVFRVATSQGICPATETRRVEDLLLACGLPIMAERLPQKRFDRLLAGDKKKFSGKISWVVPEKIGSVLIDQHLANERIIAHMQK